MSYVLDVGYGVGATPCYLPRMHDCRAIGAGLWEAMIVRANDRARREGIEDLGGFRMADAHGFRAYICESSHLPVSALKYLGYALSVGRK